MRAQHRPAPDAPLAVSPSPSNGTEELALICEAAGNLYGVPLHDVVEVTRAVAVTAPSGDVDRTIGYIDLRGDLVPVMSGRAALGLTLRDTELDDRFVVVRASYGLAAVQFDGVAGVEAVLVPVRSAGPRPGLTVTRRATSTAGSAVVTLLDVGALLPAEPLLQNRRSSP